MNTRDYGTLHLHKVNEQEKIWNITLRHKVNEHERLWNITLRHKVNEHRDYGTLHLNIK